MLLSSLPTSPTQHSLLPSPHTQPTHRNTTGLHATPPFHAHLNPVTLPTRASLAEAGEREEEEPMCLFTH
jgi:hypothetical protein